MLKGPMSGGISALPHSRGDRHINPQGYNMALSKALKELFDELRKEGMTEAQAEELFNKNLATDYIPKSVFNEEAQKTKAALAKAEQLQAQITELQKSANLTDEQKGQIDKLTAQLKEQEEKAAAELKEFKQGVALEKAIADAKGRDAKSILPHIDKSKLAWSEDGSLAGGLKEQIETLQKERAYLFDLQGGTPPADPQKPSFGGSPTNEPPLSDQQAFEAAVLKGAGL